MLRKVLALSVFCLAAVTPLQVSAEESCSDIQAWVASNANNLPDSYDTYMQYSSSYRRAMWAYLSPQVKSAIWTHHLELFLNAHPDLTAEQLDVVKESSFLATPDRFEDSARSSTLAALKDLQLKAQTVFAKEEVARLLVQLGPVSRDPVILQPLCSCSDDWDCGGGSCTGNRCSLSYGCGPYQMDYCMGVCSF